MNTFSIAANIVDIPNRKISAGRLFIEEGRIKGVELESDHTDPSLPFAMPGFIDSHVHIESSMLVPAEFARLAVVHGTVATVSDPHEIANVCGMAGVEFMIDNGRKTPFKFYFGAPSCVPATGFESAGAQLDPADVKKLLDRPEIKYLSEMMNFPGVINGEAQVLEKIAAARNAGKPIDGHAPGLRGEPLKKYVAAGISTDHECFTREEAIEKLALGMDILIREGSAAKNFEALIDLLHQFPARMMFCSDDKHPDSLAQGHINELCRRAIEKGIDLFNVLQAACSNPVQHYGLDVGLLRAGDPADFIIVKDPLSFEVVETYICGECVARKGRSLIPATASSSINHFNTEAVAASALAARASAIVFKGKLPVIGALDGQLITQALHEEPLIRDGLVIGDPDRDILKIAIVNRYTPSPPAVAFIKGFGLKQGAIASSVAHDSHNIIAVGADDESLAKAINLVIAAKGGISCTGGTQSSVLELPVAGLMSGQDGYQVAATYTALDRMAKSLGSELAAPFMTLSFMGLLVIPSLKLSDRGLFDGDRFSFVYTV